MVQEPRKCRMGQEAWRLEERGKAGVWVGAIAWVGARAWEGTAGHGPGMGQEYRVVQYPRK